MTNDWISIEEKENENRLSDMSMRPHQCSRCHEWILDEEPSGRDRLVIPSAGMVCFLCEDCTQAIMEDWKS